MDSFNVYGQTEQKIGGNTPVWLGTVKPIPVGAVLDDTVGSYTEGGVIPAGLAGIYDPIKKEFNLIVEANALGDANAYLYNDIYAEDGGSFATCALVMHHPEGLLIERVYPEITEEQIAALQAKIPGVLLVRG